MAQTLTGAKETKWNKKLSEQKKSVLCCLLCKQQQQQRQRTHRIEYWRIEKKNVDWTRFLYTNLSSRINFYVDLFYFQRFAFKLNWNFHILNTKQKIIFVSIYKSNKNSLTQISCTILNRTQNWKKKIENVLKCSIRCSIWFDIQFNWTKSFFLSIFR